MMKKLGENKPELNASRFMAMMLQGGVAMFLPAAAPAMIQTSVVVGSVDILVWCDKAVNPPRQLPATQDP